MPSRCPKGVGAFDIFAEGKVARMALLRGSARVGLGLLIAFGILTSAKAADPVFQRWLQGQWPDAQALGVSRRTFEAATQSVEPDLSLPDLDLPGREGAPPRGQAEFVQTPADYIKERNIAHLAEQAQKLAAEHSRTLAAIEQKFGGPGNWLSRVWGGGRGVEA